jgi:hypothetical protein
MLDSVRLEIVLILTQDRCTVSAKRTTGSAIVWMHPMVLLGDVAQVEARFGPFKDSANLDARKVHILCRTYHSLRNCFRCTRWNSKVKHVESCFDPLGDSVDVGAR